MLERIAHFFLTQWIWSVTFGLHQLLIAFVLFFLLLKLWDHLTWVKALLISVGLTAGAFLVFYITTVGIVVWMLDVQYILPANPYEDRVNVFTSAISVAFIYVIIEYALVLFARRWVKIQVFNVMVSAFVANILSALIIYKLVPSL